MDKPKISPDLSVGEILRTEKEWWFFNADLPYASQTYSMRGPNVLISIEQGFDGMVGETIVTHSYCLITWASGFPKATPIKSMADFKKLVYPNLFKEHRIMFWRMMKNDELFGWSEDPRPYVQ